MSNFSSGYILTDNGSKLMADVEAGKMALKLTKLQIGNGLINSLSDYVARSALISPKNTMVITSITTEDVSDVRICLLKASISSLAVETGYDATELGIFAQNSNGEEILYGVCYDESPDYIAGTQDGNNFQIDFAVRIITTSKATVELVLPKTAEELITLTQEKAALATKAASAAEKSANETKTSAQYVQDAMSKAAGYAISATTDATTASSAASSAAKDAKAAASSAAAALESSTGATTAMNETKRQAQQAAASIAEASALVDKAEKNSAVVSEQLKQAQDLATASAGIQIYLDDDGDLAYRMIE